MVAVPNAIIFVNNDLVDQVRQHITTQLHINEWITSAEFDARVAADPDYPDTIRALGLRLMVEGDHRHLNNREHADVVTFVKNGMMSVEYNKFGPPKPSFRVLDIHWGQFSIFSPP
jgi:hypothetical protein